MDRSLDREVRVTIRCLIEDLGTAVPPLAEPISAVDQPLMDEARRVAPTAPQGQKRILSIGHPPVYRLRHSNQRAATWLDRDAGILWVLAIARREDDSDEDAFAHFSRLHADGRLLPTDDDRARIEFEQGHRLFTRIRSDLVVVLARTREHREDEIRVDLAGFLSVRVYSALDGKLEELWMAVSTRDATGAGVAPRLRDTIFALMEQLVAPAEWEGRPDWPRGQLEWFEVCRLAIREDGF
ncbi:MAG: hypothetical protein ACR2MY_11110 [Candidatus Dormibacteria bacterium]